jgi:hypothetical protein
MLSIRSPGVHLCDRLSRREVLRIGGLGACGLTLSDLLRAGSTATASESTINGRGKAKSCIILFLMGGPPQHSTWDPKPDAPTEVRGEIAPIATNVSGIQFGELMPQLARQADKLCILRGMSTDDNAHSSSGYYMLTGHPHQPMNRENANPGAPNDWPFLGAVVQHLDRQSRHLPASVRLPNHIFNTDGSIWPGQDSGFLGRSANPWLLRCEPASANYRVEEFSLPVDVPIERLLGRHSLLDHLNAQLEDAGRFGRFQGYDSVTQRAFDLLSSQQARRAFDLSLEAPELRTRYGESQFGQSVLLARRLVEAGVRLVQVNWFRGPDEPSDNPCWDSHTQETDRLKKVLVPPMDRAFGTLLQDLSDRGLLDETLVVCMAEFGRTPRFNPRAGRDHWGPVFSIALAGGGVQGGVVYGASDRLGGQPRDGMVRPESLIATILHCLGLNPGTEIQDPVGRRLILTHGEILRSILV